MSTHHNTTVKSDETDKNKDLEKNEKKQAKTRHERKYKVSC